MYAASDPQTALAEVFQVHRLIRITGHMALAGWEPTRSLKLLDLTSNWPLRNGAGRALLSAPRSTCRAWARAIEAQAPRDLDGLLTDSTLTGADSSVLVLWERAGTAFPTAPAMWMSLDSPALAGLVLATAEATGYGIG